jgi:ABC-type transport system involved in cytochrome bd biosynthesis fused ATPase/permease subunit
MFFNPRYGLLGMLSYPYWVFFEFLAPIVEFIGLISFVILAFLGFIDWAVFANLLAFIWCFGFLYSLFSIFMEVVTYNQYKRKRDILRLMLTALVEPFAFHPFVVWSAIRGNVDLLRKKNSWGDMKRQGFSKPNN